MTKTPFMSDTNICGRSHCILKMPSLQQSVEVVWTNIFLNKKCFHCGEFLLNLTFVLVVLELIGPAVVTVSYNVQYHHRTITSSAKSHNIHLIKHSADVTFTVV